MASLALSIVGTAIAGPIGGTIGGLVGGLIDNVLFPGKKQPLPTITTSTYGNAIPLVYGPLNRLGANLIWSSGFKKVTNKSLKYLTGKGGSSQQAQTYVADLALSFGAGPVDPSWLTKLWANGTVVFDATAGTGVPTPDGNGVVTWDLSFETFQDFDTITVYPGNFLQLPDPTIEAQLGVGNSPAYRGTAYIVITNFKLTTFGNAVPTFNALFQAQAQTTLSAIVNDLAGRAGLNVNEISTGALTGLVQGYNITSQTDAASAISDLGLCFDFDAAEVAGQLRCTPRGLNPYAAIINDQIGAYAAGDEAPDAFAWPRDPETILPRLAALTFIDPARDCNQNTQSAQRLTGSMQSYLSDTVSITLTSDEARKICDRMLWEAQVGRQQFSTTVSDRLRYMEPTRSFSIECPAGYEQVRITRVARGVNGVTEIEGKRDYSALYFSSAPSASSTQQANDLAIGGPVNPPIFVEPPSTFPGLTGPTLLIAVSGGEEGIVNDAWNGCDVFFATDPDGPFTFVGQVVQPAIMGVLNGNCEPYSGSNPDTVSILTVSTEESGQEPPSIDLYEAEIATTPYWVDGEYLSAETVTGLGGNVYQLTNLWRGLYGTSGDEHLEGTSFARLDGAVFRFPFPKGYIGGEGYFRFVGGGETLATVTTYTYTGQGTGYGSGPGGVPSQGTIVSGVGGVQQGILDWDAFPQEDNVTSIGIWRADGSDASFSSAALIATVGGGTTTYTDTTAAPGTDYTYFIVPNNIVGPAATPSNPVNVSTAPGTLGPQFVEVTAGADLTAGMIVTFGASGVIPADSTDNTKPAQGFMLQDYAEGYLAAVFLPGAVDSKLSGLSEGSVYYLGTDGTVTATPPSASGNLAQEVGYAADATHLVFLPKSGFTIA